MDGTPAQRYAIGSHWWLAIPGKGRHEVVIETYCKGTCDVIVVMAHPKPGAEQRVPEDWDWSNVLRVTRTQLQAMA
jgi:hypothetical protein